MLNTMVPLKDFSHSRLTQVSRDSTASQVNLVTSSIAYTTVSDADGTVMLLPLRIVLRALRYPARRIQACATIPSKLTRF